MASGLNWRGDELKARLERAQRSAINELLDESAQEARRSVPVRSGKLKRSIRTTRARRTELGTGFVGALFSTWYGRLGKNRRMFKELQRRARAKLPERIATKFQRGV